jgi:hypothetical protein
MAILAAAAIPSAMPMDRRVMTASGCGHCGVDVRIQQEKLVEPRGLND